MLKYMLESALNYVNWFGTLVNDIKPHSYDEHACFNDLPTKTNNEWINQQNAKLNKIPMCKPRPKE